MNAVERVTVHVCSFLFNRLFRIQDSSQVWEERVDETRIITTEDLTTCLDPRRGWTIISGGWNLLKTQECWEGEIMLFIGKPKGRSKMISNATNPLKESRKESLLRCAGSTSICVWLVCDLVVMCVQAVGDRALGDLCVCVRCGSVQSQKV